jgi:hypothetical protein
VLVLLLKLLKNLFFAFRTKRCKKQASKLKVVIEALVFWLFRLAGAVDGLAAAPLCRKEACKGVATV